MQLGRYEVISELGRGGAGVVLLARAADGREVAIKVLVGLTSPEARARFAREARLQATLGEAEGFVPLLETGDAPQGPFLVMTYLAGGTLRTRLARGPLAVEDSRSLALALARAVGRAHERGIVHRDLKPENVLFALPGAGEAASRAFVADLGLAKHFDRGQPGASASIALSRSKELRGTFGYMAPEQARDARSAGPPADVFALGAIAYECLVGRPPFDASGALETIARAERGDLEPLARARPETPRWLAAVVERALRAAPADRFPNANALAAALEAGPASETRAGRGRAVLVAGVLAAAFLGIGGAILSVRRPGAGPAPPPSPTRCPGPVTASPPEVASGVGAVGSTTTGKLAELGGCYPGGKLARLVAIAGDLRWRPGDMRQVMPLAHGRGVVGALRSEVLRSDLGTGEEVWRQDTGVGEVAALAISGEVVRIVHVNGTVVVRDLATGSELARAESNRLARLLRARDRALSPDGRTLFATVDGAPALIAIDHDAEVSPFPVAIDSGVVFSPDSSRLLATESHGPLRAWQVATRTAFATLDLPPPTAPLAFALDGKRVLVRVGEDGRLVAWDLESAKTVELAVAVPVTAAAFSPDGERVLAASDTGDVAVLTAATGKLERTLARFLHPPSSVAFSSDGRRAILATPSALRVWDLESGTELDRAHSSSGVASLAASPDGRLALALNDWDDTANLWDLESGELVGHFDPGMEANAVAADWEARTIFTFGRLGALERWSADGSRRESFLTEPAGFKAAAVSADGRSAVSGAAIPYSQVKLLDLRTGEVTWSGLATRGVERVGLSSDGRYVLAGDRDGAVTIWDRRGREQPIAIPGRPRIVKLAAARERALVLRWIPGAPSEIELLDLRRGVQLWSAPLPAEDVALSPDEQLIAVVGVGVQLRSASNGSLRETLPCQLDGATCVRFAPDGRRLLVGTARGLVLVYELTGKPGK